MNDFEIRRVAVNECEELQKISRQTFLETFSAGNTKADMRKYLDEGLSKENLTAELHNPESEFYFAVISDLVIGYLKLNFGRSQTELQDDRALEIERIYVVNEFHGKVVGQRLYEKAMEIARQRNATYVWLGVWEENPRAIKFYKKNGFLELGKHIFKLGNSEQIDIMMKLPLV
ncbi:MAG: GNAT family N-acetyltransferase [Chitinophagaceae bacterium]|nr:GNAT family N-acetyltransferase [Chitinophagaceae bacterium]